MQHFYDLFPGMQILPCWWTVIKDANIGCFIIRLEARLQPNIGNTLRPVLMLFTHSGITPPKVNRFGLNLERSDYILWGWPLLPGYPFIREV